ncbi:MAG TPA: response regulator transcription factor [Hellea balneolensis]|uniref:Response regulator transcription factor n=1 Tax=Hellea balneolensis TaxID=287478 RepID=A0A7C3CB91_9PROT|nr:response regulator transcription factor [Hellea balneolensis]
MRIHYDLKNLRVLVAEDEALVRQGMVALIGLEAKQVVEVSDGEQALETLKTQKFDIALIDIGLPVRTGIDVMAEVRQRHIPVKIIILTGDMDTHSPADIYKAGADAFLYKTTNAEQFLETFLAVVDGKDTVQCGNEIGADAKSVAQLRDGLTARELQIVKMVVEGASNKQTANALCISEHTVRKHREHINKKLEIRSPLALATFAIKAALV